MTMKSFEQMNANGTGGALLSSSVYRGDGKRAWKQNTSGSRTYFFYDGDTLIGTSGDAANSSSLLLWGADGLIGTQTKNASNVVSSNYFLYDAQGNLAQIVNNAGLVTTVAAYTAWGEVVPKADGTKPTLGAFGYGAKFGYWRDSDSGLYLCTLRFYDPANGRFVTRDPIGFAGGSNLFGYTGNDPANATDPSGRLGVAIEIGGQTYSSPFYGMGGPDFLFDGGSADNAGSDLARGWYAGADGLNPFGDPYFDMGFYKECDLGARESFTLGGISREAMFAAATGGSSGGRSAGVRVAVGAGGSSDAMQVVRVIQRSEKVTDLIMELKSLTFQSGNEHAVVRLATGGRAVVSGGEKSIDFGNKITRLFAHTHPYHLGATGPSAADSLALKALGQRSSYLLEHGSLTKFFR
jgi:RHS repeat-associated protein